MENFKGQERRKEHWCIHELFLGRVQEFIDSQKSNRVLFAGIITAIAVSALSSLVTWGSLTATVKYDNTRINGLESRFNNIKLIGYVQAAEK